MIGAKMSGGVPAVQYPLCKISYTRTQVWLPKATLTPLGEIKLPATVNWFSNDDLERIASGKMFVHSSRFPSRLCWRV